MLDPTCAWQSSHPFFLQTDVVHQFAVRIPLEEILSSCKNKATALQFQECVENLPFLEEFSGVLCGCHGHRCRNPLPPSLSERLCFTNKSVLLRRTYISILPPQ
jgi:hypothetical protein